MSAWLVLGAVACAVGAIQARSLVHSALWLAATSALLATLLYLLGAPVVAVVELSVGVGLVAVLFIFVVGIAGEDGLSGRSTVPLLLALALAIPASGLLLWLTLSGAGQAGGPATVTAAPPATVAVTLWEQRAADVLGQVVLIVAGAIGVVTILGGAPRAFTRRTNGATKIAGGTISVVSRPAVPAANGTPLSDRTREPAANGHAREVVGVGADIRPDRSSSETPAPEEGSR